jgi:chorismate synthase
VKVQGRWCRWARTRSTATSGTDEIAQSFNCPDKDKAAFFEQYLDGIRERLLDRRRHPVVAEGVPAGWGAPIYASWTASWRRR